MNQEQKKYLLKRIDEIERQKLSEINEPDIDIGQYLSQLKLIPFNKIVNMILTSLVDRSNFDAGYYDVSLDPSKITSNWNSLKKEYDKACVIRNEKQKVRKNKLSNHCTSLKDNIVFGSEAEALEQLAKLEKMKF